MKRLTKHLVLMVFMGVDIPSKAKASAVPLFLNAPKNYCCSQPPDPFDSVVNSPHIQLA